MSYLNRLPLPQYCALVFIIVELAIIIGHNIYIKTVDSEYKNLAEEKLKRDNTYMLMQLTNKNNLSEDDKDGDNPDLKKAKLLLEVLKNTNINFLQYLPQMPINGHQMGENDLSHGALKQEKRKTKINVNFGDICINMGDAASNVLKKLWPHEALNKNNIAGPSNHISTTDYETGCTLPNFPQNGGYSLTEKYNFFTPGDKVEKCTKITFYCNNGYQLISENNQEDYYCIEKNNWHPNKFPKCVAACPPLVSSSVEVKCTLNGIKKNCSEPQLPETKAHLECKPLYKHDDNSLVHFNSITCQKDGNWDYNLNQYACHPVCGQKVSNGAETFIIGGSSAKHGDYPWQIAVYMKDDDDFSLICGGSLLNRKVVLSAAHCFTEPSNGKILNVNDYVLIAGKFYRKFTDNRDFSSRQHRHIKSIHIPEHYRGAISHFSHDLALLVIDQPFEFSATVQPVCVDWNKSVREPKGLEGKFGEVCGWGYTKPGQDQSNELKQLEVPFVPYDECYDNVPENFREYLADDKICAGYLTGTAVCQGDSGGALVFNHNGHYFVRGIVSLGPKSGESCDPRQYTAYTMVSKHLDFIEDIITRNR